MLESRTTEAIQKMRTRRRKAGGAKPMRWDPEQSGQRAATDPAMAACNDRTCHANANQPLEQPAMPATNRRGQANDDGIRTGPAGASHLGAGRDDQA